MSNRCYVHVITPSGEEYDVGPFDDAKRFLPSEETTAVDWLYQQIGMIVVSDPDARLTKHSWSCPEKESLLTGSNCTVRLEIAGFIMEVRPIKNPAWASLVHVELETEKEGALLTDDSRAAT
jgi:hypothetical protein